MPPETTPRKPADEGEVITTFNALRGEIGELRRVLTDGQNRIEAQTTKTNGRVQKVEQFVFAAKVVIALLVLEAGWVLALVLDMRGN